MSAKRHKGRRKAKQDLKPADQGMVRVKTEQVASPVEIQVEVESFASPASLGEETERLASAVELQDELKSFAGPVIALDESENTTGAVMESAVAEEAAPSSATKTGADRRTHPRYAFTAAVEVVADEPGARLKTRVRDLSQQGCNVDTDNPFALGTVTDVRITKGAESFEAHARVVYNQPGKGMGLMFTVVEPQQLVTLNRWIAESRELSWLAANRRRSQRVLMRLPVRVSGQGSGALSFEEDTYTLAISAHGALIAVTAPVYRGQRFTLSNTQTKGTLECVVAHIDKAPGELTRVGVEFMLPNQTFWRVAFPPKDWTPRHPDAKSG